MNVESFDQTPLLELRTKAGAVYLCPSRWQRTRLQWTFRHFHTLPTQLLSRHDQRMIEKLRASGVVTLSRPVSSDAILGVVEMADVHAYAPASSDRGGWSSGWGQLSAAAAAAIVVVGVIFATRSIVHKVPALPVALAASQNQAIQIPPATSGLPTEDPTSAPVVAEAVAPAPQPAMKPLIAGSSSVLRKPKLPATSLAPVTLERRWVSELPPGHFARPVVTPGAPAGEVQLNALIAPDGSVQQVTVLSGNHTLAEAGIRAVRQWHYAPYGVQGAPTEEETQIKMSFFGPEAVSISSVPVQP